MDRTERLLDLVALLLDTREPGAGGRLAPGIERRVVAPRSGTLVLNATVDRLDRGQTEMAKSQAEMAKSLAEMAKTQADTTRRLEVLARQQDETLIQLRSLNKSTVMSFELLREDLKAHGIATRKPKFQRAAAE